ncbi:MAG: hypothetical protein IKX62_02000 [Bacteroidales bacterium]|nr:hypothetical protein [Bacteroidales bacterium]
MKLNRYVAAALLIAVLATAAGCKDDNTTETKALDGYLTLTMPPFVEPGFTKTFMIDTLMTLVCPAGDPIGYAFTDPVSGKTDTLVTAEGKFLNHYYTLTAPGELSQYTLKLSAFTPASSIYENTSVSIYFTVVRPGLDGKGSITEFQAGTSESFTDPRDGNSYFYTSAGGVDWMRQNLSWAGAGRPYRDCPSMSSIFGQYYTWEEAQTACPEGWTLPSDADWVALRTDGGDSRDIPGLAGRLMGDLYFNGDKMWEYWREVKITDELGLSVMPVGYAFPSEGRYAFDGLFSYAVLWTSDEVDGEGVCRYIYQDKDIVYRGLMSKTEFAAPVRCIRK